MKHLILFALIVTSISSFAGSKPSTVPVSVISSKRDIFYFKVDKTFIGAVINVKDSSGKIVFTDSITRHKAIIDFFLSAPDTYTIQVKKDNQVMEFIYHKKGDPLPAWAGENESPISMIQN